MPTAPAYAELQVTSNFSFLRGASHPEEMVERAAELGYRALALTDRNTLAGTVRAHVAARRTGLHFIPGTRLDLVDGPSLLCLPTTRDGYGALSRLITTGRRRAPKGECMLTREDVAAAADPNGHVLIAIPPTPPTPHFADHLAWYRDHLAAPLHLAATHYHRGDDDRRLAHLARLAASHNVPLVATGDIHQHNPARRRLHDVLTCVREHRTIDNAGWRLAANAERHLKPPAELAHLFRDHPEALANTVAIADQCRFSLGELRYEYPAEVSGDGRTPRETLAALTWAGADKRYPDGIPPKVSATIEHELALIAQLEYEPYFLTVEDIVRKARELGILCQGRGSAANSAVCYCLGVTSVDPAQIDLLFERFISAERDEVPDIDVDFEHERREEVIQYIYGKYGRDRAGLTATVITYRVKSALRDVGKAMGLSEDVIGRLLSMVSWRSKSVDGDRAREEGFDPGDRRLALTLELARELYGFPRHLSQHTGGFVISRGPLCEIVPIENAAMEDRTVIEWNKDDLEVLGLIKVDVLGLGMLSCIRRAFTLLEAHYDVTHTLESVPQEDPATYEMIQRGDTVGVFQIESRAQMAMLPRLKPATFYDLVIEVAIVRPGPIQGDMVHPYLRRRQGREAVEYPSEELREVLSKTLGVPLFQEQVMRIAIVAAGFTPAEADQLRRAMASFRNPGTIHSFRDKFIEGMTGRGYTRDFAERCFRQIEGFGEYGFPESHAASFAHLAYVSSWLKCHYPAVFACALLNSQPMGFYAPAQIVRDARDHGVEVRPSGCESLGVGLHAGGGGFPAPRRGSARAAPRPPPDPRSQGGRCEARDGRPSARWQPGLIPRALRPDTRLPLTSRPLGANRNLAIRPDAPGQRRCLHVHWAEPPPGRLGGACDERVRASAPVRIGGARPVVPSRAGPPRHFRRRTGGRRLPHHGPVAQAPPGRLAQAPPGRPGRAPRAGPGRAERRRPGAGRRNRPHPAAPRQGDRHVRHPGGRDRHRQPGRLPVHLREPAPRHPHRAADDVPRQGAEGRRRDPRDRRAGDVAERVAGGVGEGGSARHVASG